VLLVCLSTSGAEAIVWEDGQTMAGGVSEHQRVVKEGDYTYVVYTGRYQGRDRVYFTYHDGTDWALPLAVGPSDYPSVHPDLAVYGSKAHIVYETLDGGLSFIDYRSWTSHGLSAVVRLGGALGNGKTHDPAIAVEGTTVHVVWQDYTDLVGDILYRSTNSAGAFGQTVRVSTDSGSISQREPDVFVHNGTVHVTYSEYVDNEWNVMYRYDPGSGFREAACVSPDTYNVPQGRSAVAAQDGVVRVVYEQKDGLVTRVYMTSNLDSWANPVRVGDDINSYNQNSPRLEMEYGHTIVVYSQEQDGGKICARHLTGGEWKPVWEVSADTSATRLSWPDVAVLDGTFDVIWTAVNGTTTRLMHRRGFMESQPPEAELSGLVGYWGDPAGALVGWVARDDYELRTVEFYYRWSQDKEDWGPWRGFASAERAYGTKDNGTVLFDYPQGEGFYQLYALAWDNVGTKELTDGLAELETALDLTSPQGTVAINDGNSTVAEPSVVLTIASEDLMTRLNGSMDQMGLRTSEDGTHWSDWGPYTDRMGYVLQSQEGEVLILCQLMDASGLLSEVFNDTILYDGTSPTVDVVLEGGAQWTGEPVITVDITASDDVTGVDRFRLSNDGTWDTETWMSMQPTVQWTLPDREGNTTVHLQVVDLAGNVAEVSDVIGLDTVGPYGSITLDGGNAYTSSTTVHLALTYGDLTSGVTGIRVSDEPFIVYRFWQDPERSMTWDLGTEPGETTVYYQVRDGAGHVSSIYSASITLDQDSPSGTIGLLNGATTATSQSVPLVLTWDDPTSDVVGMRLSLEPLGGDEPWDTPVGTVNVDLGEGDGTRTFYYQVIDAAGMVSGTYRLSILLDTIHPTITSTEPPSHTVGIGTGTVFVIRFSEGMERDQTSGALRFWYVDRGGSSIDVAHAESWSEDGTELRIAPSAGLVRGTTYFMSFTQNATDIAGNELTTLRSMSFTTVEPEGGDSGNGLVLYGALTVAVIVCLALAFLLMRRRPDPS